MQYIEHYNLRTVLYCFTCCHSQITSLQSHYISEANLPVIKNYIINILCKSRENTQGRQFDMVQSGIILMQIQNTTHKLIVCTRDCILSSLKYRAARIEELSNLPIIILKYIHLKIVFVNCRNSYRFPKILI